jgi:hypothetical protein
MIDAEGSPPLDSGASELPEESTESETILNQKIYKVAA